MTREKIVEMIKELTIKLNMAAVADADNIAMYVEEVIQLRDSMQFMVEICDEQSKVLSSGPTPDLQAHIKNAVTSLNDLNKRRNIPRFLQVGEILLDSREIVTVKPQEFNNNFQLEIGLRYTPKTYLYGVYDNNDELKAAMTELLAHLNAL